MCFCSLVQSLVFPYDRGRNWTTCCLSTTLPMSLMLATHVKSARTKYICRVIRVSCYIIIFDACMAVSERQGRAKAREDKCQQVDRWAGHPAVPAPLLVLGLRLGRPRLVVQVPQPLRARDSLVSLLCLRWPSPSALGKCTKAKSGMFTKLLAFFAELVC